MSVTFLNIPLAIFLSVKIVYIYWQLADLWSLLSPLWEWRMIRIGNMSRFSNQRLHLELTTRNLYSETFTIQPAGRLQHRGNRMPSKRSLCGVHEWCAQRWAVRRCQHQYLRRSCHGLLQHVRGRLRRKCSTPVLRQWVPSE